MQRDTRPALILGASTLVALVCGLPAVADDTEIFVNQATTRGLRPNVMLVVDTSLSMNGLVEVPKLPYDPARTYAGSCTAGLVYWSSGDAPPSCANQPSAAISDASNTCKTARSALAISGRWMGKTAQWDRDQVRWGALRLGDEANPIECLLDAGDHGETDGSSLRFARNGDDDARWSSVENTNVWASAATYALYDANYLNYYQAPPDNAQITRLATVQAVAKSLVNSIDGINIGLMRFSHNPGFGADEAEGGMVMHEIADIGPARAAILDQIDRFSATGFTPLSETYYEAGLYFAGRPIDYGINSRIDPLTPFPSVAASLLTAEPPVYRSPISFQCQRNFVVVLTDGEPTRDRSANNKATSLPGFGSLVGACDGAEDGRCFDELAEYFYETDLAPLPGQQNLTTYTVGFGPDVSGSALLDQVARRGGGRSFFAADSTGLTRALQDIFSEILDTNATFTTPSVSVNAFNRAQTLDELYVSVFRPEETLRWPGNLKKYRLQGGRIVDALGQSAVDPTTGFFRRSARSVWSVGTDGDRVDLGGAASQLPVPAERNLYTFFEATDNRNLTVAGNRFDVSNAALSDAVLGTTTDPTREQVLRWARGFDVLDADGDGNLNEPNRIMGDPLHARPAVVSYGGDADSGADALDQVAFVPTNDGVLHAVNARNGRELWAFVAPELLGRLIELYRNRGVTNRSYGLDGDVRVLKFDVNQDGVVDAAAGDRVWIYFGMRRGGRFYYALDVTDRNTPRMLWKLGPAALPGIGESWSTPAIARVRIAGATQNGENLVLIIGGGYDDGEENYDHVTDTSGHRIFMVDAASGELLWYAGGPNGAGTPDLALSRMTNAIPSRVSVLDTNGDRFADRMYAADLGGRIWRFDIFNGNSRAELVTGGIFARLGAGDAESPSIASTRRFYYAPDVALIQRRGADVYYNLAVGSGYRGHPLHTATQDRFYSLRDHNPFGKLSQNAYENRAPLTEADLTDITGDLATARVPAQARGWKLELRLNGGWIGEKVLAEAVTINGVILFPTYQPLSPDTANPCVLVNGINRVYALNVDNGRPALDFNDDPALTAADASTQLAQAGIAGEVSVAFEAALNERGQPIDRDGDGIPDSDEGGGIDAIGRRTICSVGVEVLRKCVPPGSVVRTFWQRTANNSTN